MVFNGTFFRNGGLRKLEFNVPQVLADLLEPLLKRRLNRSFLPEMSEDRSGWRLRGRPNDGRLIRRLSTDCRLGVGTRAGLENPTLWSPPLAAQGVGLQQSSPPSMRPSRALFTRRGTPPPSRTPLPRRGSVGVV